MSKEFFKHIPQYLKLNIHMMFIITGILIIPFLSAFGFISINTYHIIMEAIVILLSFGLLTVVSNTWSLSRNHWFKYLGICFGILCIFMLCHIIFYHDNNIVDNYRNLDYVFDLYEGTIRALSISVFLLFSSKYSKANKYLKYLFLIPIILIILVIINKIPPFFIRGDKPFNPVGQIIILALLLINIYLLLIRRRTLTMDIIFYISSSTLLAILCEIMVMINIEAYNISILSSHLFKVYSVFMMYKLIINQVLEEPVEYLNENLVKKNQELREMVDELNIKNIRLNIIRKELTERKKSYKSLISNLPMPLVLRQEDRIILINDAAVKLFKKKDGNIITGHSFLEFVHPDYIKTAKKNLNIGNENNIVTNSNAKLISYDNEIIDAETTIMPIIFNNKKTQLILIKDLREINRSKKMKKELELAKDNERVYTEFFTNLSHEFRTPLNVIYTSSQLIDVYTKKSSIENIANYNKIIKHNCFRISKLVNNILDSTRIGEGLYDISYCNNNFVKVVEDTVLSIAPYLEKNNVEIIFDTDVEEKYMVFDEEKIERIVLNLISNAVKYKCKTNSLIEIKILDMQEEVILSVKDNGIGIPKEKQKTVFNKFIKADQSLNRGREGSGLGLYIVKSLVELHEGTIELFSEENIGSEFIIKLPVITSDAPPEENNLIRTKTMDELIQIEFSDIYNLML